MAGTAFEDAVDGPEVEDGQEEEDDVGSAVPEGGAADQEGDQNQGPYGPPPGIGEELQESVGAAADPAASLELVEAGGVVSQEEDLLLEAEEQEPARVLADPLLAPLVAEAVLRQLVVAGQAALAVLDPASRGEGIVGAVEDAAAIGRDQDRRAEDPLVAPGPGEHDEGHAQAQE